MQATINLYETFSEALHTVQELEASQIVPSHISLITKNGKSNKLTIDFELSKPKVAAKAKKGSKPVKPAPQKPEDPGPIDRDLKAKFFSSLNLFEIPGLGPIVGAGWLVTEAVKRTPSVEPGISLAIATGLINSMVEFGLSLEHAETYVEGLKRGATLIGVITPPELVRETQRVMREEHRPLDPHMRGHHYWTTTNEIKEEKNATANRLTSMLITMVR